MRTFLAIVLGLILSSDARSQPGYDGYSPSGSPWTLSPAAAARYEAEHQSDLVPVKPVYKYIQKSNITKTVDRSDWPFVRVTMPDGSAGSGTLVDVNDGKGLILTCFHVASYNCDNVKVRFLSGVTRTGRTMRYDKHDNDIMSIVIDDPPTRAIKCAPFRGSGCQKYVRNGFGGGRFVQVSGRFIDLSGTPRGASYPCGRFSFPGRSGDSGCAITDDRGRFCAILWGTEGGNARATVGKPIQEYLTRLCQACDPRDPNSPCWNPSAGFAEAYEIQIPDLQDPNPPPAPVPDAPVISPQPPPLALPTLPQIQQPIIQPISQQPLQVQIPNITVKQHDPQYLAAFVVLYAL